MPRELSTAVGKCSTCGLIFDTLQFWALLYCRLQNIYICGLYPAKSYPAASHVIQYSGLS